MTYAVILTALDLEYQAVKAHLTGLQPVTHPAGTVYETGKVDSGNGALDVALAMTGKDNAAAASETERALAYFKPKVALFVGIAGRLKDVELGDVVIGESVHSYERGSAGVRFLPKPNSYRSTYDLVQTAIAQGRSPLWHERIKPTSPPVTTRVPAVKAGPVASGEKTVKSTRSLFYRILQLFYGDCLVVEMEGFGFLKAAHANPGVKALLIRGVSDRLDNKEATDEAGYQDIAAQNASAFAIEVLLATTRASSRPIYRLTLDDDMRKVERQLRAWQFQEAPTPNPIEVSSAGLKTGSTTTTTFHRSPSAEMANCRVECDVRIMEHGDDLSRWVGIRVRGWHNDIFNGYLVYLRAKGTVELYRAGEILDGQHDVIVEDTREAWTRLRVDVRDDNIQVFVNDKLHLQTTDRAFGEGYVYLHTYGTVGEFANFAVSQLE